MVELNLLPWRIHRRNKHKSYIKAALFCLILFFSSGLFYVIYTVPSSANTTLSHPAMNNKPIQSKEPTLFNTPLSKLRWAGFIMSTQDHQGLINLPNGNTIPIRKGNFMGLEHARILRIDENGVLIFINGGIKKFSYAFTI